MTNSTDATYTAALIARYLAIHPEHAYIFEELPPAEHGPYLAAWLDTWEGRRYTLADECESTALTLAEIALSHGQDAPEEAERLWQMASELRQMTL